MSKIMYFLVFFFSHTTQQNHRESEEKRKKNQQQQCFFLKKKETKNFFPTNFHFIRVLGRRRKKAIFSRGDNADLESFFFLESSISWKFYEDNIQCSFINVKSRCFWYSRRHREYIFCFVFSVMEVESEHTQNTTKKKLTKATGNRDGIEYMRGRQKNKR
jgi:hypothetical protein